MNAPLIFSTAAYDYLAKEIAALSGWELGSIVRKSFPDGEHYQRIDALGDSVFWLLHHGARGAAR